MSNFNQAEFYFKRAETYYNKADYQTAVELFEKVINLCALDVKAKNQFHETALVERAFSHSSLGNYAEAIRDCSEVIEFAPNNAWAWAFRGVAQDSMNNKDEAIADLSIAFEIEPNEVWIIKQIIDLCLKTEEYTKALEYAKHWEKIKPKQIEVKFRLGYIYVRLGDADKAFQIYAHTLGLVGVGGYQTTQELAGKEDVWVDAGMGAAYRLKNELDRALACLDRSLEMYDRLGWVWAERGEVYHQLQKYPEAVSDFRRALDLDNSLTWVDVPLQDCIGKIALQEDEARYRRIIKANPYSRSAYTDLGDFLEEQGRFKEAEEIYRKAIELDSAEFHAYYGLERVLKAQNRHEEAKALMKEYWGN